MKDSIPILGKPYKVKTTEQDDYGIADAMGLELLIKRGLPKPHIEETRLHETLEIINSELELGLTHPQICAISIGMYSAGARV